MKCSLVGKVSKEGSGGRENVRTKKVRTADISVDRSVVDNGVASLHMRKGVLGEVEEGVDVGFESEKPGS